jgi:hypothetical protein
LVWQPGIVEMSDPVSCLLKVQRKRRAATRTYERTSAVPVSLLGLGVEADLDAELLSDPVEEEPAHPQLVGSLFDNSSIRR